ncbi:MAG: ABC transporter ATP-binding protein [Clostridia bacterium]|nr:ABC transporter ATP-binding protein [Clostridia bacterium]
MIRFDHVSFGYGEGSTVHDLCFSLEKGGITALIGANGAGKSTVSKLMRGLLHPTSGTVYFHDQDMATLQASTLAARMGFLFQNPDRQICRSTVRDELLFSLQWTVPDASLHEAACQEVMDALSLSAQDDPMMLSRGERQRVALATALVHKPELLILDEPTTGLDYRECTRIMEYVSRLEKQGTRVVMVCHDMEVVLDYADEILVLSGGHLLGQGSTEEVFQDTSLLRAASLLPPQMIGLAARLGLSGIRTVEEMTEAIGKRKAGVQ